MTTTLITYAKYSPSAKRFATTKQRLIEIEHGESTLIEEYGKAYIRDNVQEALTETVREATVAYSSNAQIVKSTESTKTKAIIASGDREDFFCKVVYSNKIERGETTKKEEIDD